MLISKIDLVSIPEIVICFGFEPLEVPDNAPFSNDKVYGAPFEFPPNTSKVRLAESSVQLVQFFCP